MATFATDVAAEERARAKGPAGDNTWLGAFSCKDDTGQPAVRVYRTIGATGGPGWATLTDDGDV